MHVPVLECKLLITLPLITENPLDFVGYELINVFLSRQLTNFKNIAFLFKFGYVSPCVYIKLYKLERILMNIIDLKSA